MIWHFNSDAIVIVDDVFGSGTLGKESWALILRAWRVGLWFGVRPILPPVPMPVRYRYPHDCLVHRQLYETSNGVLETFYTIHSWAGIVVPWRGYWQGQARCII